MVDNPLLEHIQDKIYCTGPITFADFMRLALYHKQWGYYTQYARVGRHGDFYTSPHVNPLFGRMLARQLHQMWLAANKPDEWILVEYGPGEGLLTRDILITLRDEYPGFYGTVKYRVLEISDSLAGRQKELLSGYDLGNFDIEWVSNINGIKPSPFQGCIFSNELIDAFPVHLVKQTTGGLKELYVIMDKDKFKFIEDEPSTGQIQTYFALQGITLEDGQTAEVNLEAINWLKNVAEYLARGFLLTIDYGNRATELYSPARLDGTLRCFFRHQLKASPLENVGKQDITANVNFTALEKWGERFGLKCSDLVTQSQFLINLGIFEELKTDSEFAYDPAQVKKTMAIKQLVMPAGMGNAFKVLIQYKGFKESPRLSGIQPRYHINEKR